MSDRYLASSRSEKQQNTIRSIEGRSGFAGAAALPHRTDGVHDVAGRKAVAASQFGVARVAAAQGSALLEEAGACGPMDRAVDPATA